MQIQIETWLTDKGYMASYKIGNVLSGHVTCDREDEAIGRALTEVRKAVNKLFCPPGSAAVDAAMAEDADWLNHEKNFCT